jgi:hypothetical protein
VALRCVRLALRPRPATRRHVPDGTSRGKELNVSKSSVMRHPITGRFMSGDCERDCLTACAGLCGVDERICPICLRVMDADGTGCYCDRKS